MADDPTTTINVASPMNLTSGTGSEGPKTREDSFSLGAGDGAGPSGVAPAPATVPSGASVYSPSETPSDSLNPRSCVTCRKRKVKCDKLQPCTNCRRARIPCVFPAPGRAPRRPRPKDPNAPSSKHHSTEREVELMKRLRKLEGIVEELSGQIDLETTRQTSSSESPEAPAPDSLSTAGGGPRTASAGGSASRPPGRQSSIRDSSGGSCQDVNAIGTSSAGRPLSQHGRPAESATADINRKFGRLVLHEKGKSRYVSSGFWSRINDEINELRAATEEWLSTEPEDSDVEDATPDSAQGIPGGFGNQAFLFGYRAADVDLRSFHPLPSQIPFLWQVFDENVNSIVKILHSPTMTATINEARNNLDNLEAPLEALLFTIYMGTITSMEEDEVQTNFGSDKAFLLSRYRFAAEMALARAEFLSSTDTTTFQAFVFYVTLVRRRNDTRYTWTMAGLAARISHSLGLHRDPSNFPGISPFEGEMRRRLFWYLVTIDFRAAEDQGTDPAIVERTYDTRLPLNINDADFGPESAELPPPREGVTEMTFLMVLFSIQKCMRRVLNMTSAQGAICPKNANMNLEECERLLEEIMTTIDRVCPLPQDQGSVKDNGLAFMTATVGRVIHGKMTLLVYRAALTAGPGAAAAEMTPERTDRLLTAAIEVFEYGNMLELDLRAKRWRWIMHVFMQWQAAAYLLLDISGRPWSPMSERAWSALSVNLSSPAAAADLDRIADNAAVWLPFRRLYMRARRHRDAEIARLRADKDAARQLDLEYYPKTLPTAASFGTLSGSIKTALAQKNWRKLVDAPPIEPELLRQRQLIYMQEQQQQQQLQQRRQSASPPGTRLRDAGPGLLLTGSTVPPVAPPAGDATNGIARPEASVCAAGLAGSAGLSGDAMDYMDKVMAQTTFAPIDFWSLAPPDDALRPASGPLGFGLGAVPDQQPNIPGKKKQHQQQQQQPPPPPPPQSQSTSSDTPLLDAIRKTDPPLWLYPYSDGGVSLTGSSKGNAQGPDGAFESPTTKASNVPDAAAARVSPSTGSGPSLEVPDVMMGVTGEPFGDVPLEDFDINMDQDDFNWQSFNDSIRGFPTGGVAPSVWNL